MSGVVKAGEAQIATGAPRHTGAADEMADANFRV